MKNLKKYSSKQLLKMVENGNQEAKEILIGRGIIQETTETPEDLTQQVEESRVNKGRKVKFLCTKTGVEAFGIIKGVRLDKRTNFIQYRIKTVKGMYGKGIHSEDLEFVS